MAWTTEKSVVAGFGLGVVLLLALAVGGYRSLNELTEATQQVAQAYDALDALADVRVAVTDAETGARGSRPPTSAGAHAPGFSRSPGGRPDKAERLRASDWATRR